MSKPLIDDIKGKLHELGRSPDQIAKSLRTLGINGRTTESDSCPIANYIIGKFPYLKNKTRIGRTDACFNNTYISGAASEFKALFRFIQCFDNNKYPDLIDLGKANGSP